MNISEMMDKVWLDDGEYRKRKERAERKPKGVLTMRASSVLPTWELKNVITCPTCSTLHL